MEKRCTSCRQAITNDQRATTFSCPTCNSEIARCGRCRQTAVPYKCPKCEFGGP